jgi:hypothetical protein
VKKGKTMRKALLGMGVLLVSMTISAPSSPAGDDKDVKKKANVWMKSKLAFSRSVLEGLTDGDFGKITRNAIALNVATHFDVMFRPKNPDYKHQVLLFENANNEIIRQAQQKNLYGATLAYNQLVVSCVQCHQMLRDARQ